MQSIAVLKVLTYLAIIATLLGVPMVLVCLFFAMFVCGVCDVALMQEAATVNA